MSGGSLLRRARLRLAPAPAAALDLREYESVTRIGTEGPAPLAAAPDPSGPLDLALVIPPFRRGSGGHATIAHAVRALQARGHRCSLWLHDPAGRHAGDDVRALFEDFFGPVAGAVHADLGGWKGADVAVATGWQTVPRLLALPGAGARAYLVQDHEAEFYATSAERVWAASTYALGLHAITAGPWLVQVLREQYGAAATPFDLAVDHERYRPPDVPDARRADTVAFYARATTPRRGVPLGLLALAELHRRRPQTRIVLYGEPQELDLPFPAEQAGVLDIGGLAALYGEATVGMVLSLTNYSLIAQEMLACGLPCVELDLPGTRAAYGAEAPLELAPPTISALAGALARLLDDPALRARRAEAGRVLVQRHTWAGAAQQIEAGLRAAIAARG